MVHPITESVKYLFMMVDPDINTTNPTYVGLHTAVANLSLHDDSSSRTIAKYIAPMPDGSSPHNYTLLLFKQPEDFSISPSFNSYFAFNPRNVLNRVNFPLQQFIAQTGLGKPVAANWFQEASTSTSAGSAVFCPFPASTVAITDSTSVMLRGGVGAFGLWPSALIASRSVPVSADCFPRRHRSSSGWR